jgi:predicted lipoprotein with Yx(FWY)xxD motif
MSAFGISKLGLGAVGATAVVALVAGCASSSHPGNQAGGASGSAQNTGSGASGLKSGSTSIGKVLVDASGHTVYELVGDTAAKQTCSGGCLAIWPAVQTNGTQTVVNGHPAFTYVGDKSAGQANGQNVTDQWGKWLALGADGNPISAAGSPKAPASHSSAKKSKAPSGGGPAF